MQLLPIDEAIKQNPDFVKQNYPQLYSQYTQQVNQPQAQLQQTQASTDLTQADKQQVQLQLQKNNYLNETAKQISGMVNKQGYVDPTTYNSLKARAPGIVSSSDFDNNLGKFTDPSQQYKYNTDAGRALQLQRGILTTKISSQINDVLKQYDQLQHAGPIEGKLYQNPLYKALGFGGGQQTYEDNKDATASTLMKSIDGVNLSALGLNATDIAHVIANLPSTGDNKGAVQSKLQNLKQSIVGQGIDPKILANAGVKHDVLNAGDAAKTGMSLLSGLLGGAVNTAQDVGTGIRNKMEQPNLQKQQQEAQNIEQRAQTVKDPSLQKILYGQANTLRGNVANESGNIGKSFSADAQKNPLIRALTSAGAIAGAAEIPGAVSGGAKVISSILAGGGGKGLIAGDVLKSIIPGLSGGKKAAGESIQAAAEKGSPVNWDTIAKAANDKAANMGTKVQNELKQLLMDEKPIPSSPGEIANPVISSPQALELRKGLGERLPSGFYPTELQKIFGSGGSSVPRNKAIGILRDSVSAALKEAAPDIKAPDKLYSFYSKIHGDAPAWGKRILVGAATDQVAKHLPTPLRGAADILPALLAVH